MPQLINKGKTNMLRYKYTVMVVCSIVMVVLMVRYGAFDDASIRGRR
jgi:hypothetical protein